MFRRDIPGRDAMSVGIDEKTGQIWVARTKFGMDEENPESVDIVHIDRADLPDIIKHLQDALKHDA